MEKNESILKIYWDFEDKKVKDITKKKSEISGSIPFEDFLKFFKTKTIFEEFDTEFNLAFSDTIKSLNLSYEEGLINLSCSYFSPLFVAANIISENIFQCGPLRNSPTNENEVGKHINFYDILIPICEHLAQKDIPIIIENKPISIIEIVNEKLIDLKNLLAVALILNDNIGTRFEELIQELKRITAIYPNLKLKAIEIYEEAPKYIACKDEIVVLKKRFPTFSKWVGNSDTLLRLMNETVAESNKNDILLVIGETGTGKTLVAEAIAKISNKKCVFLNAAELEKGTSTAELFGHASGAFTGGPVDERGKPVGREGLFGSSDGRIICLDEIHHFEKSIKAKLLRVMEYRKYTRMGEDVERAAKYHRLIGITNKTSEELDRDCMHDFYARFGPPIKIPSLDDRDFDKQIFYLKEARERNIHFSPSALAMLGKLPTKRNFRDIQGTVRLLARNFNVDDNIDKENRIVRPEHVRILFHGFFNENLGKKRRKNDELIRFNDEIRENKLEEYQDELFELSNQVAQYEMIDFTDGKLPPPEEIYVSHLFIKQYEDDNPSKASRGRRKSLSDRDINGREEVLSKNNFNYRKSARELGIAENTLRKSNPKIKNRT